MRCAHWCRVPLDLAREAWEKSAAPYIDRAVQCQLSAHDEGEHFGLLTDSRRIRDRAVAPLARDGRGAARRTPGLPGGRPGS